MFNKLCLLKTLRSRRLWLVWLLLAQSSPLSLAFTIKWDASPDRTIVGYRVYYGTSSRTYTTMLDAGKATSARIMDPPAGTTYYVVVAAYGIASIESSPSAEVAYTLRPAQAGQAGQTNQPGTGNTDFNVDGKPDILWRHPSSGEVIIRLTDGIGSTAALVSLGIVPLEWKIAGMVDAACHRPPG